MGEWFAHEHSVLDRGEIVYMVIRRQAVEMRKNTCQLNACQIPKIAGREAERFLEVLRENTHVQQGRTRCELWVPFEDVVDELQPLLDFAERPMPPPEENYFFYPRNTTARGVPPEFKILRYKDHPVLYQPSNKQLNATQLVKANGRQRFYLPDFWRRHPNLGRVIRCGGHVLLRGTYVHLEDARVLCEDLGILFEELKVLAEPDSASQQDGGHVAIDEGDLNHDMLKQRRPGVDNADSTASLWQDCEGDVSSSGGKLTAQRNRESPIAMVASHSSGDISEFMNSELWKAPMLPEPTRT